MHRFCCSLDDSIKVLSDTGPGVALSADVAAMLWLHYLQRAVAIRQKQQQAAEEAEAALFAQNPDADYWAPRSSLPPPAGLAKAQQTWAAAAATAAGTNGTSQGSVAHQAQSGALHAAGPEVQVLQLTGSKATHSFLFSSVHGKPAGSLTAGEQKAAGERKFCLPAYCASSLLQR
jgi:hypothetical protein